MRPGTVARLAAAGGALSLALLVGAIPAAAQSDTLASAAAESGTQTPADSSVQHGTDRPDAKTGILWLISGRVGYLITDSPGFSDRPVFQVDGGLQFGPARPGESPRVALTVGIALGAGDFLGESASESYRLLAGVQVPVAVSGGFIGTSPVEIVPVVQAGYQRTYGQDDRAGFTGRTTIGLRLLPKSTAFFFTFEPVSLFLLAPPPADASDGSRLALEIGIVKFGWRF